MKLHLHSLLVPILMVGLLLALAPAADAKKTIFEIEDPRDDDHGNGLIQYPLRVEFENGDLDLLSFKAREARDGTWFEAVFANPVKQPGPGAIDELGTGLDDVARYGFYNLNIDIYVDTDREPGSGAVAMLPGRHAEVAEDSGWEKAVILTPRPNLVRSELQQIMIKEYEAFRRSQEDGDVPDRRDLGQDVGPQIDERVFFPRQVRVVGQSIRFFVPDRFFGGPAKADWGYVVVVSGANLLQSFDLSSSVGLANESRKNLGIVPVSPGSWRDRFGGGRENEALQPPLVDMLVPAGERQEPLLSNFDSADQRPAKLPAVVPSRQAD